MTKGELLKKLQEALWDAFPTVEDLRKFCKHKLDENLNQIAGSGLGQDIYFRLIQWADAADKVPYLIEQARLAQPTNRALQASEQAWNAWQKAAADAPTTHAQGNRNIPTGQRPPLGSFPANSRMAKRHDPAFSYYDDDLMQIASVCRDVHLPTIALSNKDNLGTKMAVEFVYRYGAYFPGGVYWIDFSQRELIAEAFASCHGAAADVAMSDWFAMPVDERVERVKLAFAEPIPRLLVFDNVTKETLDVVNAWRPITGGCCVLMTSSLRKWDGLAHVTPLKARKKTLFGKLGRAILDSPTLAAVPDLLDDHNTDHDFDDLLAQAQVLRETESESLLENENIVRAIAVMMELNTQKKSYAPRLIRHLMTNQLSITESGVTDE